MTLEVRLIPETDRPQIERMLDHYLRELSRYREIPVGANTAAAYPYLDAYWSDPDRFPFGLWLDGELAGFVLVRRKSPARGRVWQVAEFYVKPEHRRRRVGTRAAATIWRRHPGEWELEVMRRNKGADRFWAKTITEHATAPPRVRKTRAADGRRKVYRFVVASDNTG